MTAHDLYLLSPELSMVGLATVLLLLDLVMARKSLILGLGVVGLIVPLGFTVALWFTVGDDAAVENTGVLADTLVVDKFALFFKFLFIGAAAVVGLISIDYVQRFERFRTEFFALALYSATGMMLMATTVELITLYISLELSSLPLVALAAFLRDGRSSEGAMKFLVLGGISSAILLYGMVYVFGFTGTTYLDEVAARIGDLSANSDQPFGSYALLLGIALIIAGFGFKITAVPFQMWAPDVYEGSPTPVTAFLSVASKAAGFAIILRVFYMAFPVEGLSMEWSTVFAALAALSMTVGNLVAIAQSNIKRLLAYSTIAHGGYLMVGLAAVAAESGRRGDGLRPVRRPVLFGWLRGDEHGGVFGRHCYLEPHKQRRNRGLRRHGEASAVPCRGPGLRVPVAYRHTANRRLHHEGVRVRCGGECRSRMAGRGRRHQQRDIGVLLFRRDQGHVPVVAEVGRAYLVEIPHPARRRRYHRRGVRVRGVPDCAAGHRQGGGASVVFLARGVSHGK